MLASITPLGERGRQSTWAVTVGAFALGASVAGAALGAAAAAAGRLVLPHGVTGRPGAALLAGALIVAVWLDARPAAVPGPRRQVDERWLVAYRGWVYGAGFGAQLGVGLVTVVASAATYVALLAAVLSRSVAAGALVVGTYGIIRGLTPLAGAHVRTPAQLMALHRAMTAWERPVRWATVAGLGTVAAAAVGWGVA